MTKQAELVVSRVSVELILGMRDEYRRVMASQIVHDSYHARGFTDSYLFEKDDQVVGYGSYLVQEMKRLCYESGGVPVARANKDNIASRSTLERAGILPYAHVIRGRIPPLETSAAY